MEKKAEPSTKIKKRNKGIQGLNFGLNKINVTIVNLLNADLLYFSLIAITSIMIMLYICFVS